MFYRIKNIWHYLSYLGVKPEHLLATQKRIVLSNQLAIVAYISLLSVSLMSHDSNYVDIWVALSYLSIFSILTVLLFNKAGYYKITSIMLSVLTPIFTLFFSTITLKSCVHHDIMQFYGPRILLISELCLPFILIDFSRKKTLLLVVIINLLCIFLFDPVHRFLQVDLYQLNSVGISDYILFTYFCVSPVSILLFSFYFLMDINHKYENKIYLLVNELTEKNDYLEQQKEEISAQLNEISTQKETIQKSFDIIESKNLKITDSINYALKIQKAVLPSTELTDKLLLEYFILFKPRDIVSGDFYFIQKVDQYLVVVAADCTGHGVPGAFMSMLGLTMINELIHKHAILSPAALLNDFRANIKNSLQQNGQHGEPQDGMDIAFCVIDTQTNMLHFAGAYNPCWIFRRTSGFNNFENSVESQTDIEFIELPANRQPIGVYLKEKPFTEHRFQLQKGDAIYLFSDGYYSQFGGINDRKFKSHQFKNLLHRIQNKTMQQQKEMLENEFILWQNNSEQTDDVLVMGIKI